MPSITTSSVEPCNLAPTKSSFVGAGWPKDRLGCYSCCKWNLFTLDWQVIRDIEERLEKRLGRLHARLRLGIEADHEAQVFGQGINYFHIENSLLPTSLFVHASS